MVPGFAESERVGSAPAQPNANIAAMSSAVIRTWNFDDAIFMIGLCSALSKWVRLGRRITLYAGDVAWGAMFFVLFCAVRPTLSTARAWLAAVVTTENTAPQRKAIHSARAPKTQLSAPHQAQDQSPQLEKPAAKP